MYLMYRLQALHREGAACLAVGNMTCDLRFGGNRGGGDGGGRVRGGVGGISGSVETESNKLDYGN